MRILPACLGSPAVGLAIFCGHVCSTQEDLVPEVQNNLHGEEDPAAQLAKAQLQALNWGMLEGRQVQDLDTFIDQQGALNVLYAIWCSQGKRIQNIPLPLSPGGSGRATKRLRTGCRPNLRVQEERPQQAEDSCRKEVPKVPEAPFVIFATSTHLRFCARKNIFWT